MNDILVITQILLGPFKHDGLENYEEVYEQDRKPIPGVLEEEVNTKNLVRCHCKVLFANLLIFVRERL